MLLPLLIMKWWMPCTKQPNRETTMSSAYRYIGKETPRKDARNIVEKPNSLTISRSPGCFTAKFSGAPMPTPTSPASMCPGPMG
ncbi:hypothetical protein DESC_780329 [Desulfosarcina cetonica]|nr:hypothetical protein DESC_780329 [Desulfosarcina cetonica]